MSELVIIPSRGGVFEVAVDDVLVHSKKASGDHADPEQVVAALRNRG
ncbi:MAG: Rdx family protein [Actinomycetota bacterium]|nr:Rdx family protein [Actinomycetota bacterium]